ncbi:hypothetical protein [Paeniglutamicibacter sp. Y32M11]|uniref:hypothetical protein n=1 Tax=Paeniglutamicibacter sp. Y32M11 TaxID=2853258 RepID=UPI001C527A56|nr:hypothetical protein [Paeniglutamicibacter sp. Y32M11]QXQ10892.1 hypothetical protein KUF55_02865 [Paeniglutamicibacter sp. Y32M11]
MSDQHPSLHPSEALKNLAEVELASISMAERAEPSRPFMIALVAIISTVMALIHAVPWGVSLSIFGLGIPLGIWYFMTMRMRPKSRTILSHSGPYMRYALLMMLITQVGRFWEAHLWWEIGAKWIVVFVLLYFCISRMRSAAIKNRVKDANEHSV